MLAKEIYKVWARTNNKWSAWVRPVPFVALNYIDVDNSFIDYTIPKIFYLDKCLKDTAIFLDVDGILSIKEGIALAQMGYFPVPLFNGTNPSLGSTATTDNARISTMLIWGASELKNISIPLDAPPVFLLDDHRLNRYKSSPKIFDNSWDIYHQDVPSAKYLLNSGITNIIVHTDKIHKDLGKILFEYQKYGLNILVTDGFSEPKKIILKGSREGNNIDDKIFW